MPLQIWFEKVSCLFHLWRMKVPLDLLLLLLDLLLHVDNAPDEETHDRQTDPEKDFPKFLPEFHLSIYRPFSFF